MDVMHLLSPVCFSRLEVRVTPGALYVVIFSDEFTIFAVIGGY